MTRTLLPFLAIFLAGCTASSTPVPDEPGFLAFAKTGSVALTSTDITWTFHVANPGDTPSPRGSLEVTIDVNHGALREVQRLDVPALAPDETEPFQFQSRYAGPAHYSASARLLVSGEEAATDYVAFERCTTYARLMQGSTLC